MNMTPQAWILIGIGVAILVAIATSHRQTRTDVKSFRDELRADMKTSLDAIRADMKAEHDALRTEFKADISALDRKIGDVRDELGGLRERMAKLEGLLEGLREAIAGRQVA